MAVIDGACRQGPEVTDSVAIVTQGEDRPHVVATWGDYIRVLGIGKNPLLAPAGHYVQTEINLRPNPQVQVFAASRQVQGTHGSGQGCLLTGTAEIRTEGDLAATAKRQFPWARGVPIIRVESAVTQLYGPSGASLIRTPPNGMEIGSTGLPRAVERNAVLGNMQRICGPAGAAKNWDRWESRGSRPVG